MNLFERTRTQIAQWFARSEPQPALPQGITTTDPNDLVQLTSMSNWSVLFKVDQVRERRLRDLAEMDVGDVEVMLDATVDAALTFEDENVTDDPLQRPESFKLVFPTGKNGRIAYGSSSARAELERLIEDCQLRQQLAVFARDMLLFGDAFGEIVPSQTDPNEIVLFQHKRVQEMRVNRDEKGRLVTLKDAQHPDWGTAYQQVDPSGKVFAGWHPHEMIHFKLFPDNALTYSKKGMLDSGRADWKKLNWIEQSIVIARVVRAYPRLLHILDMTGKGAAEAKQLLNQYVKSITFKTQSDGTEKRTPLSVDEDFFITSGYHQDNEGKFVSKLTDVKLLDPQFRGGEVTDVEYSRRKIFNRMPGDIVGVPVTGTEDISAQDIAYGRFVRRLQFRLEDGLRVFFDRQLKLKGITGVEYRFVWPKVIVSASWKLADSRFRLTMAERNELEMGTSSPEQILRDRGFSQEQITQIRSEWLANQRQLATLEADAAAAFAKATADVNPQGAAAISAPGKKPSPGTKGAQAGDQQKRTSTRSIPTSGRGQAQAGNKGG